MIEDSNTIAKMTERNELLAIYRKMVTIRKVEDAIADGINAREIGCPCHLYSGEEAIAVGVCADLNIDDWIFSSHRSHGHYLAKGGDLDALMAEVYCREAGCSKGRGGSMHLSQPEIGFPGSSAIVAGSISLAVGVALAFKMEGKGRVAATFFGDGAVDEGVFYESLNIAALYSLPILFVCENNLYSTHLHISKCIADTDISKKAEAMGVAASRIDGNNVLTVRANAKNMIEKARKSGGPSFLECMTYRHRGHVGPNFDIEKGLRSQSELDSWREKDPIKIMADIMVHNGKVSGNELRHIDDDISSVVQDAKRRAIGSSWPDLEREKDFVGRTYKGGPR